MIICTEDGTKLKVQIPTGSYLTPQELESTLYSGVLAEVEEDNY
jgi:hypothetical protein